MTKKTRNFVLGAAGILAAGLTTGLVASLGLPVSSRAAGPADLEFIPADAAVVGYANVQEVMASELRQRLRKLEPDTRERHGQALSENQPHDIALGRTEGDTHADLTRPLLRRIRDHAVEAERRQAQRQGGERADERQQEPRLRHGVRDVRRER